MTDWLDALERLTRLYQSGALTEAEFADQKARLLHQQSASGDTVAAGSLAGTDPSSAGFKLYWLFCGLLGAALLGVLLWWRMVDDSGLVKPVAVASTPAAGRSSVSGNRPEPVAVSAAPGPAAPASPTIAASGMASAAPTSAAAFSPSFSCAGELDDVLKLICGNRELARKDRLLAARFKAVLRDLAPADQQELLRRQREFLRDRAGCDDLACLNDWYDRVNEFYL